MLNEKLEEFLKGITKDNIHKEVEVSMTDKKDNVKQPNHYTSGNLGIEVIDIIQNSLSKESFEGFLVGNVIKYICRYKLKNGEEDLKKAKWYLERTIKIYEKLSEENND